MRVLVICIIMTAQYHPNIARASDVCGTPPPPQKPNIKPLTFDPSVTYAINAKLRFHCVNGYVRKAGTSSMIRCIQMENGSAVWEAKPFPLVCIPDPNKPQTTERNSFTASNEVTTKTRTTTICLSSVKITTKETESPTTANKSPSSESSSFTSSPFMTTRSSSLTQSSPITTTAVNDTGRVTGIIKSTIGGVAGIFIILLAAALLLLWWRLKHRATNSTNGIQSLHTYIVPPEQMQLM